MVKLEAVMISVALLHLLNSTNGDDALFDVENLQKPEHPFVQQYVTFYRQD